MPEMVEGQFVVPHLWDAVPTEQREDAALLQHLVERRPLFPFCLVSYYRRPMVCRIDPTLRATVDTGLRVSGPGAWRQSVWENGNIFLPPGLCVIEFKFHWAMPLWLLEIVREAGLILRRYSKYCAAMESLYPRLAVRGMRFRDIS